MICGKRNLVPRDGGYFTLLGLTPAQLVGDPALSPHHTHHQALPSVSVYSIFTQMNWKGTLMGSLIKWADDIKFKEEARVGCPSGDPKGTHESGVIYQGLP